MVAFTVTGNLGLPELPIPLWGSIALGTAVPETPIHKDRQALFSESEVWLTQKLQMPAPSRDSVLLEDLDQRPLGALVPISLDQGHHLGPLLLGEDISHGFLVFFRSFRSSDKSLRILLFSVADPE